MQDFIKAKLYSAGGNISKRWYAYYFVRNPDGNMVMVIRKQGINRIKDKRQRIAFGNRLIKNINELLANGRLVHFKPKETGLTLIQHLEAEYKRMEGRSRADTPSLTRDTCIVYKSAMNIFIQWLKKNKLQDLKPMEFTKQHAYAYSDYMIQEKKYSGVTYNTRKVFLGVFFNALVEREVITVNYFEKLKSLPKTTARIVQYSEKQLKQIKHHLLKVKKKPELLRFFYFIEFLLMRGKGITKIQLHDINTQRWVVLIYGDKGKTKLRYAPTIPEFMRAELKKLKQFPGDYYLFSKELKPGPTPITVSHVRRLWRKHVKVPLGLPEEQKMYHGKHTGITRAYTSGKSIKGIQLQAGHRTEEQTRNYLIQHGLIPNDEFADMK